MLLTTWLMWLCFYPFVVFLWPQCCLFVEMHRWLLHTMYMYAVYIFYIYLYIIAIYYVKCNFHAAYLIAQFRLLWYFTEPWNYAWPCLLLNLTFVTCVFLSLYTIDVMYMVFSLFMLWDSFLIFSGQCLVLSHFWRQEIYELGVGEQRQEGIFCVC